MKLDAFYWSLKRNGDVDRISPKNQPEMHGKN